MPNQAKTPAATRIRRLTPVYGQVPASQKRKKTVVTPAAPPKPLPAHLVSGSITGRDSRYYDAWQATVTVKAKSVVAARKAMLEALSDRTGTHYRFEAPRTDDLPGTVMMEMTIVTEVSLRPTDYFNSRTYRPQIETDLHDNISEVKGFLAGELRHIAPLDAWHKPLQPPAFGRVLSVRAYNEDED